MNSSKTELNPLDSMNELFEWLNVWEKSVAVEKRGREAANVDDITIDMSRRKKVALPKKQNVHTKACSSANTVKQMSEVLKK